MHAGSGAPKQPQITSCSSATACIRTQESKVLGRDAETDMRHSNRGTPGALLIAVNLEAELQPTGSAVCAQVVWEL